MLNENLKLDPNAVRLRASFIPGCLEIKSATSSIKDHSIDESVCSFLVGCQGEPRTTFGGSITNPFIERKPCELARITVYCDTGTVTTGRVQGGIVRHSFRRNITSLDVVERCLRQPVELPAIDWSLIGQNDQTPAETTILPSNNLDLLDVGIAILSSEKDKLVRHEKSLDNSNRKKEAKEFEIPPSASSGMEFQFSLAAGPMKHVDQCLNDINRMGKFVRWVATNGVGTVFLYGNGGVAYTPSIPPMLYQRLSQLRSSKMHSSRPSYVSLGTKDRYFVSFYDGSFNYSKGPKGLDRELKKQTMSPLSVAFGSSYDSYFIVFQDGTFKYQGRGVPGDLVARLSAHMGQVLLLSSVSLGPSGEWFIRSNDGQVGWGGVTKEMDVAIQDLLDNGHSIHFLDFGENGSYFISYD